MPVAFSMLSISVLLPDCWQLASRGSPHLYHPDERLGWKKDWKKEKLATVKSFNFLKIRLVPKIFILKSEFKWLIQVLFKWDIYFTQRHVCFYDICNIVAFDSSFTIPIFATFTASVKSFQHLLPSEILTAIIEWEWHETATVFCDHHQNAAADASASLSLKSHNRPEIKRKKKSQSIRSIKNNISEACKVALWSLLFLCVVCNCGEEHVPLRTTPRLLQLMTAGGSSLGAVWQHLLRY